jgi:hypothetical protein
MFWNHAYHITFAKIKVKTDEVPVSWCGGMLSNRLYNSFEPLGSMKGKEFLL